MILKVQLVKMNKTSVWLQLGVSNGEEDIDLGEVTIQTGRNTLVDLPDLLPVSITPPDLEFDEMFDQDNYLEEDELDA